MMTTRELSNHLARIDFLLRRKDYEALDLWIKDDLYTADPLYLLCYLNVAAGVKDKLAMWTTVRDQVANAYGKKVVKGL